MAQLFTAKKDRLLKFSYIELILSLCPVFAAWVKNGQ